MFSVVGLWDSFLSLSLSFFLSFFLSLQSRSETMKGRNVRIYTIQLFAFFFLFNSFTLNFLFFFFCPFFFNRYFCYLQWCCGCWFIFCLYFISLVTAFYPRILFVCFDLVLFSLFSFLLLYFFFSIFSSYSAFSVNANEQILFPPFFLTEKIECILYFS